MASVSDEVLQALEDLRSRGAEPRRSAHAFLVDIEANEAIEAIVESLGSTSWAYRIRLVAVLIEIGAPALPALESAVAHGVWYVRAAAVEALSQIRGALVFELLLPLLRDRSIEVRKAAGRGMARACETNDLEVIMDSLRPLGREHLLPFLRVLRDEKEELYAQILSLRPELGPGAMR
ncbi:MAG: hypothetical protein CME06_01345 [Gemmatimonadetes bacterium]|nr:hypothetical protein [Gemmatimonadota bacterium]